MNKFFADAARIAPEQRPAAPPLERMMNGTPVTATSHNLLPHSAQPQIDYTPAPRVKLRPVTDTFTVHCLVSPDQSWPHLKTFLTRQSTR